MGKESKADKYLRERNESNEECMKLKAQLEEQYHIQEQLEAELLAVQNTAKSMIRGFREYTEKYASILGVDE